MGTLVYGIARGALEGLSTEGSLLEAKMSGASGEDQGDQDGDVGSRDAGASAEGTLGARGPRTSDYMLRTLRALVE